MSFDPYEFDHQYSAMRQTETIGEYTAKTFLWMVLGLMITFGVAVVCWMTNVTLYALSYFPWISIVLLIATLIISFTMSGRIERMSHGTAVSLFVAFSVLFGFTLSVYLFIYSVAAFIFAFLLTAVYFGALAAYGYLTGRDLSGLRTILITGLIFLVVVGVLSIFIPFLGAFDKLICLAGIAVFLGFTAYDTQKIKSYYHFYAGYPDMLAKASVYAALQLYLDFLNLFLYLLRFFGNTNTRRR